MAQWVGLALGVSIQMVEKIYVEVKKSPGVFLTSNVRCVSKIFWDSWPHRNGTRLYYEFAVCYGANDMTASVNVMNSISSFHYQEMI